MCPHLLTEDEIVAYLQQRDERAISLIYDKYSSAIFGAIYRIVPNMEMAQEVFQDSLIKVWENADKYDSNKGRFFTWLFQIARNTALDRLRSTAYRQIAVTFSLENTVSCVSFPTDAIAVQDSGLKKVVANLDPAYRTMIDYFYFNGYSQTEIAEKFSMPLGTVKTRIRAAVKELQRLLQHDMQVLAAA